MIKIAKRNGNYIDKKGFKTLEDMKNGKWCYLGGTNIKEINREKSYVDKLYCESICGNCYAFGTSWDIRCNETRETIHKSVKNCERFENAKTIAKELIEKLENDKVFHEFCKIANSNMNGHKNKYGRAMESQLEIFLAIFKKYNEV